MANVAWPTDLPHQPFRDALSPQPSPRLKATTEMEEGNKRQRRRFTQSPWVYPIRWHFDQGQFELFKTFYQVALDYGTAWFDVLVFHGEGYATAACQFVGEYKPRLQGVTWFVDATLDVDGLKVLTKAQANARWPGAIP